MKFISQPVKITLGEIKVDPKFNQMNIVRKHGPLLPNNIRAIICGPSNSGKTNVLLNLIYSENGLAFENIYLYSKSRYQPKYLELEEILKKTPEIGYFPFDDNESVIPPNEARQNSIFIFDDVACERQEHIRAYFCMGRHRNVDSFYLAQTYTRIPKHLVRDNANFLILFRQDHLNLRHIYNDHVNTDMSFKEFCDMCGKCWNSSDYQCFVVDKTKEVNDGRYRRGFDEYIMNE